MVCDSCLCQFMPCLVASVVLSNVIVDYYYKKLPHKSSVCTLLNYFPCRNGEDIENVSDEELSFMIVL